MSRVGTNSGHGHVWTRPDGYKARCGGLRLCRQCAVDLVDALNPEEKPDEVCDARRPFFVGDRVRKTRGYSFPGTVVAVFTNLKGDVRLVVECTEPGVAGMLHIFNPDQMELDNEPRN